MLTFNNHLRNKYLTKLAPRQKFITELKRGVFFLGLAYKKIYVCLVLFCLMTLPRELGKLRKLRTPAQIQNLLNKLKINFEERGDTCMSPLKVLREGKAHCVEGAMLAAVALKNLGHKPLVVDLEAHEADYDHVIAVFKERGCWGAIGKTNHAVLRYREPIYKSIRELAMSYFHEYFLNENGKKTLRRYSMPVNLGRFDKLNWMTAEEDVWFVPEYLANVKHFDVLTKNQIRNLRKADKIEIEAGKLVDEKYRNY